MEQVTLEQIQGFECRISYGGTPAVWVADEPPPLGQGKGPSPAQLLASAVGNCLMDSLYFALTKYKNQPKPLRAEVDAEVGRNADNKLRILKLNAKLYLGDQAENLIQLDRILAQFESFCTVTQSVAGAIPVELHVIDSAGQILK